MLFRVFMLLSLYATSAHGQDFVCGYVFDEIDEAEVRGMSPYPSLGLGSDVLGLSSHADPINVLVLFGKFPGEIHERTGLPLEEAVLLDTYRFADRDGNETRLSTQLVDPTVEGSLAHYFEEMSNGNLHLASADDDAPTTWYDGTADPGLGTPCSVRNWSNALEEFSHAVLHDAYNNRARDNVDFTNVDLVAVITPRGMGNNRCPNGTFFRSLGWTSSDGAVTINRAITSDRNYYFSYMVGVMAHEYGHALWLPELFDRTNALYSGAAPSDHSAGVGYWGVMGRGTTGYEVGGFPDGPTPMSAWSRAEVGWITPQPVSTDQTNLAIHATNSASPNVIRISVLNNTDEYFLLSNRQSGTTGSYYDDFLEQSGLLIWHIDESVRPHLPRENPAGSMNSSSCGSGCPSRLASPAGPAGGSASTSLMTTLAAARDGSKSSVSRAR
ncbi:MAG: immune inhibitor A [Candidatus Latescibacteria bacterium]|nr:immune inhibitor A [Candidatus Latescibacterota bacterium]